MMNMQPHTPNMRPLVWDDAIFDLQEKIADLSAEPMYIVGGAVRDAYLHRPLKDLDITTRYGHAITLARKVTNAFDGDIYIMDRERDVARVFLTRPSGDLIIDFAGFRGEDLQQDLLDRDFTMNAMAVDLHGDLSQLIDPHNAENDIRDKALRLCSPDALLDDPLRVIRAIRQSVQFSLRIAPETIQTMRLAVNLLTNVSQERIRDEFFNCLILAQPTRALRVMHTLGVFDVILPELVQALSPDDFKRLFIAVEKLKSILIAISPARTDNMVAVFDLGMLIMQFNRYRTALNTHIHRYHSNDRQHSALLILGMMLNYVVNHDLDVLSATPSSSNITARSSGLIETCATRLRLSAQESTYLTKMLIPQHDVVNLLSGELPDTLTTHRFWYPLKQSGIDALLIALSTYLAETANQLKQSHWLARVEHAHRLLDAYFNQYDTIVDPMLLVDGSALINALDLSTSPIIGTLLTLIREAQVSGKISTSEQAIALARQYYQNES